LSTLRQANKLVLEGRRVRVGVERLLSRNRRQYPNSKTGEDLAKDCPKITQMESSGLSLSTASTGIHVVEPTYQASITVPHCPHGSLVPFLCHLYFLCGPRLIAQLIHISQMRHPRSAVNPTCPRTSRTVVEECKRVEKRVTDAEQELDIAQDLVGQINSIMEGNVTYTE